MNPPQTHEQPSDAEFDQMITSARRRIHQTFELETRPWWRRLSRLTTATVIAFSAGGLAGGAYAASQVLSPSPDPAISMPTAPPKVGENVTIGPWHAAKPAPDLVPIDLEDGRSGFLRTYDLAHGSKNPKFERKTGEKSYETVLPVYAEDGHTVIGEFVAGTVSWE